METTDYNILFEYELTATSGNTSWGFSQPKLVLIPSPLRMDEQRDEAFTNNHKKKKKKTAPGSDEDQWMETQGEEEHESDWEMEMQLSALN